MSHPKGLVFSIFFVTLFCIPAFSQRAACSKMKATVEVIPATATEGAAVKVESQNDDQELVVHLVVQGISDVKDRLRLKEGRISDVVPGNYDVILVDKKGKYCSETHRITIN
jgi:hypothetical protein